MLVLRIIRESVILALQSLWLNKLRTSLSILGITIGIFSIILVFSITDSMEKNIRSSIESLGNDVVFVQKWPWEFGSEYPWWKYMNRPTPTFREMDMMESKLKTIGIPSFTINIPNRTAAYRNNTVSNLSLMGVSHTYVKVKNLDFAYGRYFTDMESASGRAVAMIGHTISQSLFGDADPLGREISLKGIPVKVIGVFKPEGESLIASSSLDQQVIIPFQFARNFCRPSEEQYNPTILVKPNTGVSMDELEQELRGTMRSVRRLSPTDEDNFALNKITLISKGLTQLFKTVGLAGWIIGGFSILVGGFGIANIMFVSVKERTPQIGVQKALGARQFYILLQFLAESVTLTIIGGLIGIGLVFMVTKLAGNFEGFTIALSWQNFLNGTLISIFTGIIFGFIPANQASRLVPVEAIRTGM